MPAWPGQVAHRDVKPANLLLTSTGELKLADLGLARDLDLSRDRSTTKSKGAAGTYAYMAPEAWADSPLRTVAGDIWAVGVLSIQLVQMIQGGAPIGIGEEATVQRQVEARLSSVAGSCSPSYLEAVRSMLVFAHEERATARELLCEAAFYEAAAQLRASKPALVELHSLEQDAKQLAVKKQALEAKRKAEAEAAEEARVRAGGCPAGGEHNWQWHQGRDGYGRACFKCLEVQDNATGEKIWWCQADGSVTSKPDAVLWTFVFDPRLGCNHINLIDRHDGSLGGDANQAAEAEWLFAPYSFFTVESVDYKDSPTWTDPHRVVLRVAPDNRLERTDVPNAPWG